MSSSIIIVEMHCLVLNAWLLSASFPCARQEKARLPLVGQHGDVFRMNSSRSVAGCNLFDF